MGSYFAKVRSRQTMCVLLNELPDWFFGPRRRIAVNQAVLKLRQEMVNSEDDWDSALDFSLDSAQTADDCTDTDSVSGRKPSRPRASCCCQHSAPTNQLNSLQEELRLLREQIAKLLEPTLVTKESQSELLLVSSTIPVPPPLPLHLCSTPIKRENLVKEENTNCSKILQDLTNIKLRPVQRTPTGDKCKSRWKCSDIRNDLHEILKRRYAAMHSPAPRRIVDVDSSDGENSFKDKPMHIQRHSVMTC